MTEAQKIALQRAIANLKATGFKYAVETPEGILGELEIKPPEAPKTRIPRVNFKDHYMKFGVTDLKPSESVKVPIPPDTDVYRLSHAIFAKVIRTYGGKDNVIVAAEQDKGYIEVLRVV